MKNLSGGNYALATICRWWLRDEAEHVKEPPTQPMMFGNAVHRCIEAKLLGKTLDPALAAKNEGLRGPSWPGKIERRVARWEDEAAKKGWVGRLKPEQAFAFNTITGAARPLEGSGWRKFQNVDRTCEITLIADAWEGGAVVEAYDWKTGRVNQMKDVAQIQVTALAIARFVGASAAVGHVVYIDEDGCVDYQDGIKVDEFDMLGFEATLERIFRLEDSEPIIGQHCKSLYCPAKDSCMKYVTTRGGSSE